MKLLPALLLALLVAPSSVLAGPLDAAPRLDYRVERRLPHDATLFTQGLAFHGAQLVASGGGYGDSRLLLRELASPSAVARKRLPRRWFAEGITVHDGVLYLLTWREGIAQRLSLPGFEPEAQFSYQGEGWGLASDGHALIQSDGSATLAWRDPATFAVTRRAEVTAVGVPVTELNELEWVQGWVLANVWQTDWIVGIDPASGAVRWTLSLQGLLSAAEQRQAGVANGIAMDTRSGLLWVTGKNWPWLFGLRLTIPPAP